MRSGTINDITKLHFYTDRGYELPMKLNYIIQWELVSPDSMSKYIKTNPKGYIIGDVDMSDPDNIKIKSNTLMAGIINGGEFYAYYETEENIDREGRRIFGYNSQVLTSDYWMYLANIFFDSDNIIRLTVNTEGKSLTYEYTPGQIFGGNVDYTKLDELISVKRVSIGNNIGGDKEFYDLLSFKQMPNLYMLEADENTEAMTFVEYILSLNIANLGLYFPFVRYLTDFYLDPISTNFLDVNTIVVLEECNVKVKHLPDATHPEPYITDEIVYRKPCISSETNYSLVFKPTNEGELKIISPDTMYEVQFTDSVAFYMGDSYEEEKEIISYDEYLEPADPFSFAIAVEAKTEGAYLNFLGINMKVYDDNEDPHLFFMGVIVIKTEIIGEDERFRTLLGNFGVPDPIKYPNIFAELDYLEEGKDYELINRKSKELMLTYDEIFSYVGTYKALMKAIKFLGYLDIVFKEWYTLMDSNDNETDIAVEVFDTTSGKMLLQKLASYGVSIEDFKKYNKINKLSMIYHMNEEDNDNYEYLLTYLMKYDKAQLKMVVDGKYLKLSEVPLTKPIYEYRNDEITAKLFAVKNWLETNIIGVNAYIADITGEGIYFGWLKTQGYSTLHVLADYSAELYYTPDVKSTTAMVNSNANIKCTLTELNDSVKICEYENLPFSAFIKGEETIDISSDNISCDTSTLYISNSFEAPVLGDEYEFELNVIPTAGTLCEWTGEAKLIYINDGEISLLFNDCVEAPFKSLPIISLENANIHTITGNWRNNIEWSVREVIDQETGNVLYKFTNSGTYRNDTYAIYKNDYFILVPNEDSTLKYSEDNKWKLPMFMISGYDLYNVTIDNDKKLLFSKLSNNDYTYILEILKGDMYFKELNGVAALLSFSNDNNYVNYGQNNTMTIDTFELQIGILYIYKTDRKLFIEINTNGIDLDIESSTFSHDDIDDSISLFRDLIDEFYDTFATNIEKYIDSATITSIALIEASTYVKEDTDFLEENQKFLDLKKELMMKKALYEDYTKIYEDNYKFNLNIDISVNRLGKYNVIAHAYDKYNNIYVNKYDKQTTISGLPLDIDIYVDQENSLNTSNFYRYNKDGKALSFTEIDNLVNSCNSMPTFPKNYSIYDFDYDMNTHSIEFDNMSYAIDTPKNNDFVRFDNYTERCLYLGNARLNIDLTKITLYFYIDAEPLNRVNIYNGNAKVNLCIYDEKEQKDYACIGPFIIESKLRKKSTYLYYAQAYIDVKNLSEEEKTNLLAFLRMYYESGKNGILNTHKLYLLNILEYTIDSSHYHTEPHTLDEANNYPGKFSYIRLNASDVEEIIEDTEDSEDREENEENNDTPVVDEFIIDDSKLYFKKEDVVKIRYYLLDELTGLPSTIINETAYRIIDIVTHVSFTTGRVYGIDYVLNGELNESILKLNNVKVTISLANHYMTHYLTKVDGNAREFNYLLDDTGNYILKDIFNFTYKNMFLDDYIDDTYSGIIFKYDPDNLKKMWFNPKAIIDTKNAELFYYNNYPITVKQGKLLILTHNNKRKTFIDNYFVLWKWYNDTFDEAQEILHKNTFNKELLFESTNDKLSIMPEYLGTQDIDLTCIDKYGNTLINSMSIINVIENEDFVPTRLNTDNTIFTANNVKLPSYNDSNSFGVGHFDNI